MSNPDNDLPEGPVTQNVALYMAERVYLLEQAAKGFSLSMLRDVVNSGGFEVYRTNIDREELREAFKHMDFAHQNLSPFSPEYATQLGLFFAKVEAIINAKA